MKAQYLPKIAKELKLRLDQVNAVAQLLAQEATIPFIARYRKEATGSLDEVIIGRIRDSLLRFSELDSRRKAVLKSLKQHGHLNDDLHTQVTATDSLAELEDIYLPYKPKRRTRAGIARQKGLEPLAQAVYALNGHDPRQIAAAYVDSAKGVTHIEDALAGARDIMAEWINEDTMVRAEMRRLFNHKAHIQSRVVSGKETKGSKYKDYFEWQEPAATAPSHRVLAMRRGEQQDILNLTTRPPEFEAYALLERLIIKGNGADVEQVRLALRDCYRRLLSRSMETEIRLAIKERADTEAIRIFADNLRQLLMAPPYGPKAVMGIDPGLRTGCKLVCLDPQGQLLDQTTVYPHQSQHQQKQAAAIIIALCVKYRLEAIALGNGTGGRETEAFLQSLSCPHKIDIIMVSESGASVYSASPAAREEFPDLDITFRSAVSIGRRLLDPLSELVKIEPKAIGVGQYQHDVDQQALKKALEEVVISCVNAVGVDVNVASEQLLTYVSGVGPQLARNIVAYRKTHGTFRTREELRKVPRLGPKAFEQAAGFLRIKNGPVPLDASAVHPERYPFVAAMAADLGCDVADLLSQPDLRTKIDLAHYVSNAVGRPTLEDIMEELNRPGLDPRNAFASFRFAEGVHTIEDLRPGMRLPGIITNITAFGAFVDLGVHQDGLIHISKMSERFVKDPGQVVKLHQHVQVTVLDVDLERKRIALALTRPVQNPQPRQHRSRKPAPVAKTNDTASDQRAPKPFNNPFAELWAPKK